MKKRILSLLFLTSFVWAKEPTYTYKLLSDVRSELIFPRYSLEEKKIVIDQARLVMSELFVHRDLKIEHFGKDVDPLPLIADIESKLPALSDKELHIALAAVFDKQNDRHTSYSFPKPLACHRGFLPFSFKEVNYQGNKVIAVESLVEIPEAIKPLRQPHGVKVGDILLTYDGMSIEKAIELNMPFSAGANPPAMRRRSISLLSVRSFAYLLAPQNDDVVLEFKNTKGEKYTVAVPWLDRYYDQCFEPAGDGSAEQAADNFQLEFNELYHHKKESRHLKFFNAFPLNETKEPTLKYGFIDNEHGHFGYILLEAFYPKKLTFPETIEEIKNILLNHFMDTDGLIIDLRNNGGGYIRFAEHMVQLFTHKNPTPMLFTLLSSEANLHSLKLTSPEGTFTQAALEAQKEGQKYSKPLPITDSYYSNNLGQFYFGPVALFTNSSCYSSCDMFSAQMQDHKAATVFGEDSTTGAGGANNVSLMEDYYKLLPDAQKGPFQKLPGNQDIGLSYRQTIRTGLNSGKLIEDVGVLSDFISEATWEDLLNGSENQLKQISKYLKAQKPIKKSWIKFDSEEIYSATAGSPALLQAKWAETNEVEFISFGTSLGRLFIESNKPDGGIISINPNYLYESFGDYVLLEIIGKNEGKRVWRKVFKYKLKP